MSEYVLMFHSHFKTPFHLQTPKPMDNVFIFVVFISLCQKQIGELAQLVERVLSMHEVADSISAFSTCSLFRFICWSTHVFLFGLEARASSLERWVAGRLCLSVIQLPIPQPNMDTNPRRSRRNRNGQERKHCQQ